jgi:hypothetical protein
MADQITPPSGAPVPVDLKAGIKTTEFWVTMLASASSLVAQYQGAIPEPWGLVLATALGALYTIARAIVKAKAATTPPAA